MVKAAWILGVGMVLVVAAGGCRDGERLGPPLVVKAQDEAAHRRLTHYWVKQIRALGEDGDWLVVRGYKDADHFIVMMTNTPLSHAALLDVEGDAVIESLRHGVEVNSLEHFLDHAHRVLLIRPMWWRPDRGRAAVAEAYALVGAPYDFAGLVGLSSAARFYCSELAFHVYRAYQRPQDHIPKVIEPGQMYLWGDVIWDSRPRD